MRAWTTIRIHRPRVVALVLSLAVHSATAATSPDTWWGVQADGNYTVHLYFFWTETCPHCQAARPDVDSLASQLPWVELRSYSLTDRPENGRRFVGLAQQVGQRALSVPAFLFCGRMLTGYDSPAGMGATLRQELRACRAQLEGGEDPLAANQQAPTANTYLPGLGAFDLQQWSLPAVAITLGALDSFNPCAFFVLLFLLSLLVHARSRARMFLIGGVFVAISGLVYFLFMAAWLNLFLLIGQVVWITAVAGLLALTLGLINIKDFFSFHSGVTLSIPAQAKPGLFRRMRSLLGASSMATMLGSTIVLAVLANAYELLCASGLPMVFTRILTLQALDTSAYYGYLALYCVVYVIPLFVIITLFSVTLGQRKLSEQEGRLLKLVSGMMMTGLGLILITAPELLNHLSTTLVLLALVLVIAAIARARTLENHS